MLGDLALILYRDGEQPVASLLHVIPTSHHFIRLHTTVPLDASAPGSEETSLRRIGALSKRFLASLPLAVQ